jgi:acetyl-CoA synthetase
VNRIANLFKRHGIKKGDCVAFYVHTSIYAVAAMLACARIGAIHMCIFAEFPPHAIAMRINEGSTFEFKISSIVSDQSDALNLFFEVQCVALVTDNQGRRNGKSFDLKNIADEALKSCPTVKKTFVIDRTIEKYPTNENVINLRRVIWSSIENQVQQDSF